MEERKRIKRNTPTTKKKAKENQLPRSVVQEIWAVVIIALGAILILGYYFNAGGDVGEAFKNFGLGLFGLPAYLLPIITTFIGIHFLVKKNLSKCLPIYLFIFGILCDISAQFHLFDSAAPFKLNEFYSSGKLSTGGGFIGGIITVPLSNALGKWGSFVVLLTVLIIMVLILTGISLSTVLKNSYDSLKDKYKQSKEEAYYEEEASRKLKEKEAKLEKIPVKKSPKPTKTYDDDIPFDPNFKIFQHDQLEIEGVLPKEEQKADQKNAKEEKHIENTEEQPAAVKEEKKDIVTAIPTDIIENEITKTKTLIDYNFPPINLLEKAKAGVAGKPEDLRESAKKLVSTLKSFGVEAKVLEVSRGPSVTRFELQPSAGVKVSKIVNLADDIALNLAAFGVRIEAPIPGKAAVGIEIPNSSIAVVSLRDVLESKEFTSFKSKTAFALGKDISGKAIIADISKMPHLLIAGATGSGKSVCINTLISSIIYKANPNEVKLLMIDPKVVELGVYNGIPHLLIPVVTDPRKAAGALNWAVTEMTRRYKLFADCNVRDINGYNDFAKEEGLDTIEKVVIIIDELSDLMMVAPHDVEDSICRLAQMARAAGMHLVIATQRPSVDVITGLIKANIPSRISFAVSSQIDSRTVLDMTGAEKLLGRGDMLYLPVGASKPIRVQGAYVTDKEVESIVNHIKNNFSAVYDEDIIERIESDDKPANEEDDSCDDLLPQAIEIVVDCGQASVSLIQRRLKVGYSRAGRIVDQMEARGIIGPHEGSKPRSVLITKQQFYEMSMNLTD